MYIRIYSKNDKDKNSFMNKYIEDTHSLDILLKKYKLYLLKIY